MKYEATLNYPLDYNVESYLFNEGVNVISGEIGDMSIIIESNLSAEMIMLECDVDVKSIKQINDHIDRQFKKSIRLNGQLKGE